MKAIEIKGLSYAYEDGTVALKNIDIAINKGDRIAVLGPNGAGKSTFLKIIAGLMFPFKGKVNLFGAALTSKNQDQLRAGVGMLFQDPDDQIFMPRVWDDVAFGPINYGLSEPEVKKRVRMALKHTDLLGFEDRTPHHLSYGEKKRVAIAGIIAMKPKLLLLDEFTANLDPKSRQYLMGVIQRLKTTLIIATHDINTAIRMADKAIVINQDKLAYGTIREIFSDEVLLKRAHLDVPEVTKLFIELRKKGFKFKELPLTVDEAKRCLSKVL
ncbi:MAG: ATP-binding cassette domain-containing protein [Thermoplasmata archaeon]|nr:ATP-binding cassette domain-containing protein [Thermoplasmata archaeon]